MCCHEDLRILPRESVKTTLWFPSSKSTEWNTFNRPSSSLNLLRSITDFGISKRSYEYTLLSISWWIKRNLHHRRVRVVHYELKWNRRYLLNGEGERVVNRLKLAWKWQHYERQKVAMQPRKMFGGDDMNGISALALQPLKLREFQRTMKTL